MMSSGVPPSLPKRRQNTLPPGTAIMPCVMLRCIVPSIQSFRNATPEGPAPSAGDERRLRAGAVHVRGNGEEPLVVPQHVLQRLRRVVVEVWSRVANPAQRRDLERVQVVERGRGARRIRFIRASGDERAARVRTR